MAFYDDQEDEQQANNPSTQAGGGQSAVVGGGTGQAADAAGSAAASSSPQSEQNFVGIQKYLDANKPQSEKLAGQVVGDIDSKAKAADDSLMGVQNSFNQAADAQKVNEDDDLLNQVKANASSVANDSDKLGSFAKQRDATYTGPQTLQDNSDSWGTLQSALQTAKDAKNMAGTEEGRQSLIKDISNNPRQSNGALTFDNLLLQSNPNAAGMLQNAGAGLNDIDQRVTDAQTAAAARAKSVADNNAATAAAAKGAVTSGYDALKQDLTGREAAKDAELQGNFASLQDAIKKGQVGQDQLTALGLGANDKTFGVDPSQYLTYVDGANVNSVATNDDLARQQALQQLMGAGGGLDDLISGASPLGQVGSGYSFDKGGFQNTVGTAQDAFGQVYNPLNSQYQSLIAQSQNIGHGSSAKEIAAASTAKRQADAIKAQMDSLVNQYNAQKTVNNPMTAGIKGGLASPQRIGV